METKIPVEVSARHCHLAKKDVEKLFGNGYKLKKAKQLSQPSDFSAEETISIEANGKRIDNIRVVGPERPATQIEISKTDAFSLGINPPCEIKLIGPKGEVDLEKGLIIARRHIHCTQAEADQLKLKDGDSVAVKIDSERPLVFHDILVRVRDDYKLCLHIDTDEGNAAGINKIGEGIIL